MNDTSKDFFSGCMGGIAGTIVGHPFETVKVRIQTQKVARTAISEFKNIIKHESYRGLFRGVLPPVYSMAVVNAFLFGVEGVAARSFGNA